MRLVKNSKEYFKNFKSLTLAIGIAWSRVSTSGKVVMCFAVFVGYVLCIFGLCPEEDEDEKGNG